MYVDSRFFIIKAKQKKNKWIMSFYKKKSYSSPYQKIFFASFPLTVFFFFLVCWYSRFLLVMSSKSGAESEILYCYLMAPQRIQRKQEKFPILPSFLGTYIRWNMLRTHEGKYVFSDCSRSNQIPKTDFWVTIKCTIFPSLSGS